MKFSKIYIQDNFVPNIVEDQFRRKVIGIEITLNEDDNIEQAKELAEQYIKDYIQQNTVDPPHRHIETHSFPPEPFVLPSIQVEKTEVREQTLEEQIQSCTEIKVLESYKFIAKKDPALQDIYDKTMQELKSTNQ